MRNSKWIAYLFGSICLLTAGCASPERTSEDKADTVNPEDGTASVGEQGEPPSSEIQERAVPRMAPGGRLSAPITGGTPSTSPKVMSPVTPLTIPPSSAYVAPTQNLTAVANAMSWSHKSLTILIAIKPGLALTNPVTISIAYLSPAGGAERLTQTYMASSGNNFLRNDPVGDGKPRRIHLDITLSEPNPAGGPYNYNVPVELDLDPLYDITFGPLQFTLLNDCATLGDTHIKLGWKKPTRLLGEMDFATRGGRMTVVPGFAWSAIEASLTKPLFQPEFAFLSYGYSQYIGFEPAFGIGWIDDPQRTILAPGPVYTLTGNLIKGNLKALNDNFCSAYFEYRSVYTLRAYFGAPTVRDHR